MSQTQCLPADHWVVVLEILISVFGIIFNAITIFIIVQLRDFKKSISHWYVLQLAIADFLFLAMLPLRAAEGIIGRWTFSVPLCKAYEGIFMLNYYAGILFLTLMSFDRYVAIVHPVAARWRRLRTHGNAVILTCMVWVVAMALASPLWVWSTVKCNCAYEFPSNASEIYYSESELYDEMNFTEESYQNHIDYLDGYHEYQCKHQPNTVFYWWAHFNFVVTFLIPVTIMTVCYSLILWRVLHPAVGSANRTPGRRKNSGLSSSGRKFSLFRFSSSSSSNSNKSQNLKQKQRVTGIVISLVVLFTICWLPYHTNMLLKFQGIKLDKIPCTVISTCASLLAFSNSMLNPIFYTFLGSKFYQRLSTATWMFRPKRKLTRTSGFLYTKYAKNKTPVGSRTGYTGSTRLSDASGGGPNAVYQSSHSKLYHITEVSEGPLSQTNHNDVELKKIETTPML